MFLCLSIAKGGLSMYGTYPIPEPIIFIWVIIGAIIFFAAIIFLMNKSERSDNKKQIAFTETATNFRLFRTKNIDEYHSFLKNFDETQHELVDVMLPSKEVFDKDIIIIYRTK